MSGLRVGRLKHRVAIDRRVDETVNGSLVTSWAPFVKECMAGIEYLSAREFIAAQAGQGEITARIVIRFIPGVLRTMRVRHLDTCEVFEIAGVLPDNKGGKSWLTLPCSTGISDG